MIFSNLITPRIAVSILFLVNGFLVGNWAPKIPEFASRLSLDEGQMGLMIGVFGAGSLISMPLTGITIARLGTGLITRFASLVTATTLLWVTLAPEVFTAAIAVFLFGAFIASMDVAMNAVAVEVERKRGAPIMSSCHGFWSLGGLAGALAGGYLIQNFGETAQAVVTTIVSLFLIGLALQAIRPAEATHEGEMLPARLPRTLLPYLIGIAALFSAVPEGAVIDWGAFYMRKELGADPFSSSLAFGAFSTTMAIVRFSGDPIRQKLGAVTTARLCALISTAGFLIAGLSSGPFWVISGFAIAGLGVANLLPIAFSAAGNLPGLAPGIGISLTTTIGYSGVLVAPAIFGYIAEFTGFSFLFTFLSVFLVAVFFLASNLQYADFRAR